MGISQCSQACSPSMATLVQHELPLLPTATPETRAWRNRDGICSLVICLPFPPAPVLHVCPGTGGWDGAIKLILADRFITERSALPALCQSPPQRGMSWASPRTPGTGCTADLQQSPSAVTSPIGTLQKYTWDGEPGSARIVAEHSSAVTGTGGKRSALPQWALTLLALQVWHSLLDLSVV